MTPVFVDTNIFVRHFAQDVPGQSAHATAFLRRAETGAIVVTVTEAVLLELEHVLTSVSLPYRLKRDGMVQAFRAILGMRGLRLSGADRSVYEMALEIYQEYPIDFGDALMAARMRQAGATQLASFDKRHFDLLPGVARIDLALGN
ncbi:MAG: PIN domain-containing protein [Dehalococcoidia bacterium]|nr:PIN domain-containing protein [Dehalococcoidia bacterium]